MCEDKSVWSESHILKYLRLFMKSILEFFKSCFFGLYKITFEKNYHQKSVTDRVNENRKIRSDRNMASPTNIKKLDRWLMLQKWKEEKEKHRQEEKQKARPVFKVCRVPDEFGLPNSENLNKKIKGKPNKANICHTTRALKAKLFKSNIFCSLEEGRLTSRLARKDDIVQLRNNKTRPCSHQLKKCIEAENNNSHSKIDMRKMNFKPGSSKQKAADSKIEIKKVKSKLKEATQQGIKVGNNNNPVKKSSPNNHNRNEDHRSIQANFQQIQRQLRKSHSNPELKKLYRSDTKSQNFTIEPGTPDYATDKNSTVLNNSFRTPKNNNIYEDSIYVTASRGTSNTRKAYYVRQFPGELTPEFAEGILSSTTTETGAEYFLQKLNDDINRIEGICDMWECYKNSNKLPERANDLINVAIGWSKFLISNKFVQFRNLIEHRRKYECVSYDDLHGIWDTIQVQVEDLIKRFDDLNAMKANNWQEILLNDRAVLKRGGDRPKKAAAGTVLESLTKVANDANKSCAEDEINLNVPQIDDNKAFSGVASPVRSLKELSSLRISLFTNQAKNRVRSPSGLIVVNISSAIESGNGVRPSERLLKNELTKSETKICLISKSVLFKDDIDNTETELVT